MRINWNLCLIGEKVVLVPYRRKFVAKYHTWMQDEFIREMTASEPLTLEEEYEMQQTWSRDENKLTFLVAVPGDEPLEQRLVGDVNIFTHDYDDPNNAEIEVMIADAGHRRKGLAQEAVTVMMSYGMEVLTIERFYAKINKENEPSIQLFEKLGYRKVAFVEAFGEWELEMVVDESVREKLRQVRATLAEERYQDEEDEEAQTASSS